MNGVQTLNYDLPDLLAPALTDEEMLKELCNEIRMDDGWKEIKGGFIKDYFENTSTSKLPILKRYESYFVAAGFKPVKDYVEKNFFLSSKFKDYQASAYSLKGIIFIYAVYKPSMESKAKEAAGELSKILMPQLMELESKLKSGKPSNYSDKKPLEIIMLKFPIN